MTAIPAEGAPHKDQPFYHLFAENAETGTSPTCRSRTFCRRPVVRHPQVAEVFKRDEKAVTGRAIHC